MEDKTNAAYSAVAGVQSRRRSGGSSLLREIRFRDRLALWIMREATSLSLRILRTDRSMFLPGSSHEPTSTLYGRLIAKYAPGHSFADICCMWAMHGMTSFYAEQHGATKVTAFDGMDPTPEYEAEHKRRNSKVKLIQGDLDLRNLESVIGRHDVVWSTGLLYHTPEPFRVISDLLAIADKYAILGSKGMIEIPGLSNAAVFLPGLSRAQSKVLLPGWSFKRFGTHPAWDYEWWWALSGTAIASMIEAHDEWEVVEIHHRARADTNDNVVVVARRKSTTTPRE